MSLRRRVVVVGAGIGGLVAALLLAARGCAVTVLESAAAPGGKMREADVAGQYIDCGPTVLTMRWVFEAIFAEGGAALADRLALTPAHTLARHAWADGSRLDLFSDVAQSADAIGVFAGSPEAEGYRQFSRRAQAIYTTLRDGYIHAARPSPFGLVKNAGIRGLADLVRISPFATLWGALGEHFRDPRLRQLFGRYATYCGSSPFDAPATLMLVAHVEREGVWLVGGGMARLADALCALARENGAEFQFSRRVKKILSDRGFANGVGCADGERLDADAVIFNGDVSALAEGLSQIPATKPTPPRKRSLSALTFSFVAKPSGFPLSRHNVYFNDDYAAEFSDIFGRGVLPRAPTVYVCAQDRGAGALADPELRDAPERIFCLVNAPSTRDDPSFTVQELQTCETASFALLRRCGLRFDVDPASIVRTTPKDFAALYPGSHGALYGRASHGWRASFARSGSTTRVPGLFLAGGSVHPGPGVPMAALSGRQAADATMAHFASTRRWIPAAMPGGMSTR